MPEREKKVTEEKTIERKGNSILKKSGKRIRLVIRRTETGVVLHDLVTHTSSLHECGSDAEAKAVIERMLSIFG